MKTIRDPLYGFINLEKPFQSITATKEFQRLRNIKQLAFVYLVYPAAMHTRFEHSLGCFFLAEKFSKKFSLGDEFKSAALLHDLGHTPFSHSTESLTKSSHEALTIEKIRNSNIAEILEKNDIDADVVCNFILGKENFGRLIAGEIDVDRLDYLRRDAYYTGVAYGVIDPDIIIRTLDYKNGIFSLKSEYAPAFESILIARYMMHPTVYNHHTVRIAKTMFRRGVQELIKNKIISIPQLSSMDDIDLVAKLRSSKGMAKEIIDRIDGRRLYTPAAVFRRDDFENMDRVMRMRDPERALKIEDEIAVELKLQEGSVLIDVQKKPKFEESKIFISDVNKRLSEFSPLVIALEKAQWNFWSVGVYCPSKNKIKKIKETAKSILC